MKVVPVRLDERKLKDIDLLVKTGVFRNRSEALRRMIESGMKEIESEIEHLRKIDEIVDRIMNTELNFGGILRESLEEVRDRW